MGLEKILDGINSGEIKIVKNDTDTFKAGCNACGLCCRNRNDIILSPQDIYNATKFLGMKDTYEFAKKYTTLSVGAQSGWPLIIVKFKDRSLKQDISDTVCTFLHKVDDKYLCRIHEAKPFMCKAYPLGRLIKGDEHEVQYMLQPIDCAEEGNTKPIEFQDHTLLSWIGEHSESDEFFYKYNNFVGEIIKAVNLRKLYDNEFDIPKYTVSLFFKALISVLYFYDTFEPFDKQYEKVEDSARKIINEFIKSYPIAAKRGKK